MSSPSADTMRELLQAFLAQDRDHAVIGLDPDGVIVGWLGGAEWLFGRSAAEAIGLPVATLFLPDDRRRGVPAFELASARASGRSEDDRWHLRADGSAIWVTGTMTALRGPDGELIGFVKLMRDRTDLRTQIETLENRLEGLMQRQASLRMMLDTLGHELRNPLTPLKTAVRLIERHVRGGLPLVEPLRIVDRQIGLLERLANDLMDMTRSDRGRLDLHLQEVELQPLLRDCVAGFASQAAARGIELLALSPEAPIRLVADAQRIQQVILNLLANAMKFTNRGGHVAVRAVEESNQAVVHVEDDGQGIAADKLPDIFQLFSQGSDAARTAGLGIGLALARDIAELHGGNLEARSPGPGKGSVFSLRLPLRPPAAATGR